MLPAAHRSSSSGTEEQGMDLSESDRRRSSRDPAAEMARTQTQEEVRAIQAAMSALSLYDDGYIDMGM